MSIEQLTFLGILFTALVTIVGWIYTASVQIHILRETTRTQNLNRELGVFRDRLTTIRNITSALIERSFYFLELEARIRSGVFDFDKETSRMADTLPKTLEMSKFLYDPAFRSVINLLTDEKGKRLQDQFLRTVELNVEFHSFARNAKLINTKP